MSICVKLCCRIQQGNLALFKRDLYKPQMIVFYVRMVTCQIRTLEFIATVFYVKVKQDCSTQFLVQEPWSTQ